MTVQELSHEFDLLYNNLSSNGAPGLNEYEKSRLLTTAQEQVLSALIVGEDLPGLDGSDENRSRLHTLLKDYEAVASVTTTTRELKGIQGVTSYSRFFATPEDMIQPLYEYVSGVGGCAITVAPVSHDKIAKRLVNPFSGPAIQPLRLMAGDMVEIIYKKDFSGYSMRYLRIPKPIILEDLQDGLTINGETKARTSELNPYLHRSIVLQAVQLARAAWK